MGSGSAGGAAPHPAPLGDDLVDLTRPRTRDRAGDTRLLERVLTEAERARVHERLRDARDPRGADRLLWALWAAKEAAFKVHTQRRGAPPTFAHADYRVHGEPPVEAGERRGVGVAWPGGGCRVALTQRPDTVHAVAAGRWSPEGEPRMESRTRPPTNQEAEPGLGVGTGSGRHGTPGVPLATPSLPPGHRLLAVTLPTEEAAARWGGDRDTLRSRFSPAEWDAVHSLSSAWVRLGVRSLAASLLEVEEEELAVLCPPGPTGRRPPYLQRSGMRHPTGVSFTHDGDHLGWSVLVPS